MAKYPVKRHSPHGECGLKSGLSGLYEGTPGSLPAWGVWIDIIWFLSAFICHLCHSPHGECGLKYNRKALPFVAGRSLPAWGVWIEIYSRVCTRPVNCDRHSPHGECGLKFCVPVFVVLCPASLPAWGVWIEIHVQRFRSTGRTVTPRMGSVD